MKFFEKHKKMKILGIIILLIFLFIVWLCASIIIKMTGGAVKIVDREDISEEELLSDKVPIIREEQIEDSVFNVLLIGSDSRSPDEESGRSDSMMLVSLNVTKNKATIVSFMRDSLVEIEGYGLTKLGHSYAYGGVGLTINTINQTYDLDIQNYITINFDNLEDVIDKLGGVEVPISAEEAAYYRRNGRSYIVEGVNLLDGEDALKHARNRSLDNDFGRTRRQRSVMNGIYRKVMENKDPADVLVLIKYCMEQVRTNMEVDFIYDMVMLVLSKDNLLVQQTSIPAAGTYTNETYDGMSVLNVDIEANKEVLRRFLY